MMKLIPVADEENVLGGPLQICSSEPRTGFYRSGRCDYSDEDLGAHVVCVEITQAFLEYSRFRGNDLSTPIREHGFPGLRPGDRWCLCAARWLEAYRQGMAPRVYLGATHRQALEVIPLEFLQACAVP